MNTMKEQVFLRAIIGVLLVIIGVMLLVWRPWVGGRTIAVTGEATVKVAPDEFTFSPLYIRTAKDSQTAISDVSKVGNAVVEKLVELGVAKNKITTSVTVDSFADSSTIEPVPVPPKKSSDSVTAHYSITAVVSDEKLAQKALDYLATTGAQYSISPQSSFQKATQKRLEREARGEALRDAKEKAAQTAQELGVRLGGVVSVSEPMWGGPIPLGVEGRAEPGATIDSTSTSPTLLVGEQEVTYTVQIAYRLW